MSSPEAYRVSADMDLQNTIPTPSREGKRGVGSTAGTVALVNAEPITYKPGIWLYMAFGTLAILTIMVSLDATALSVALPIVAKKLHGTGLEAFWAATAYLLTSTVFQPTIAAFSNAFGRKWITVLAAIFFLLGILMSGLSQNFTVLLAGRTIQGIGGGGIIVLTQLIICDLIPLRLRGQWFGVISGMYAIGSVSGPLVGGVFSAKVTWRWIFWINLPFVGIALVMIPLFIRLGVAKSSLFHKLCQIDWIGSTIFIASTTGVLIPMSWGGVSYPWNSWRTYVPLTVSSLGIIGLYFYEERFAANPIIRTRIFKNKNAAAAYISVIIHGTVVVATLYYLPLYYEAVKGFSPILSGVALFPETFTVAPGAFITGSLISRTGKYRWGVWSGWFITTLGLGLLYLLDVNTSTVKWIFLNLVVGIGLGFNYSALGVTLQAATTEEDMTSAVSMFTFFRLMGQALGVVIGGVVFQNQIKNKLLEVPQLAAMAGEYSQDGSALAQLIKAMPTSPVKVILIQKYADSLKIVWVVMCAMAGLALIVSLVITDLSLDRQFVSPQQLGGDRDDVALMAEKGEHDSDRMSGLEFGLVDSSVARRASSRKKLSRWYGSRSQRAEERIKSQESGMTSLGAERTSAARSPRSSAVSNAKRASSLYSVPIDIGEQPAEIGEAQEYPAELAHPPSAITLPTIGDQPSLSQMVEDPFEDVIDHLFPAAGSRHHPRHSAYQRDSVYQRDSTFQRRSRAESSSSRPTSWAPVFGMG